MRNQIHKKSSDSVPGTEENHPSAWEQRYDIVFDVSLKRTYKIDRSDITPSHTHILLAPLPPSGIELITLTTSSPENPLRFSIDSVGFREKRLRGEVMEAWVLYGEGEAALNDN